MIYLKLYLTVLKKQLSSRIVTNGYWAKTKESANKYIDSLIESGLDEINFSTGDNHQKFVPFDFIMNAIEKLVRTDIKAIVINVEGGEDSGFTIKDNILSNRRYMLLGKEKMRLIILQSPWINFENLPRSCNKSKIKTFKSEPCDGIFTSININPNGQLLSCCGFAAEYSPILKLGKFKVGSVGKIYYKQFNDLFKIWLYAKGPDAIASFLDADDLSLNHPCGTCFNLLTNEKVISNMLLNTTDKKIKEILLGFNF